MDASSFVELGQTGGLLVNRLDYEHNGFMKKNVPRRQLNLATAALVVGLLALQVIFGGWPLAVRPEQPMFERLCPAMPGQIEASCERRTVNSLAVLVDSAFVASSLVMLVVLQPRRNH